MSQTPKPAPIPKEEESGNVIPLEKRRRERDGGTMEYDRKSGEVHVPGSLRKPRNDTPTDLQLRTPDGLPPGEAQEIVVDVELAPVSRNPIDALQTVTFVVGTQIRDKSLARGPIYYEILSGVALMGSRELEKGHFIGLIEFVEVSAKTPVRARVYDLPQIAASNNATLLLAVQGRLFAASADLANLSMRENAKLHERIHEYDTALRGRLDGIKEKVVQPLRAELHALHVWGEEILAWIAEQVRVKDAEITEQQATIERLRKDREADLRSVELTLDTFDDMIDEGIMDASEKRIAELVTILEPLLETMSVCGDMAIMQKAMHAKSALFTFKMKPPKKLLEKKPAT